MERKELLKSQRELIAIRLAQAQAAQSEFQATLNQVALELGIDPNEKWRLTDDGAFFERQEKPENK